MKSILAIVVFAVLLSSTLCAVYAEDAGTDYWPTKAWKESSPELQGVSADELAKIGPYVQEKMPQTTSILITRNGFIIFEKYYKGTADTLRNTASVTKSIVSILVGIAIDSNALPGIDTKVVDLLGWLDKTRIKSEVNRIEIGHLLSMTSGIANSMGVGIGKLEIQKLLNTSPQTDPGQEFNYNNVNVNILSMIITDKAKVATSEYARKKLFAPLGIKEYNWIEYDGYIVGAQGFGLSTRDLAKIGYLYLKEGRWEDQRIVSKEWVSVSTTKQVTTGETYRGKPLDYGYLWWLPVFGEHRSFAAWGILGQFICVLPDLDLVVILTGDRDKTGERIDIIPDIIIPAVTSN